MARGKIDRQLLIDKAAQLFRKQGYHNTTMDDIAKACRIQKASLYHHVPSRKSLVIMVIKQLLDYFRQNHFSIAYKNECSERDRLLTLSDSIHKFFNKGLEGHLLSNLAIEISTTFPEVKQLVMSHFDDWCHAIAHLLQNKYGADTATVLAEDAVAQIQGALLFGRVYKDRQYLSRAMDRMRVLLDD